MVYAAILHDVLEDTPTTEDELFSYVTEITGDIKLSMDVLRLVKELTDVYTTEDYPDINRKGRKEMEAIRLGKTSSKAQTIKYADLLDNSMDILSNNSPTETSTKILFINNNTMLNCLKYVERFNN